MGLARRGGAGGAGPAGPAGPPGQPGAAGERGATIYRFTAAAGQGPVEAQVPGAQPGDWALNTTHYILWLHDSERRWVDQGSIAGADGAAGAPGEKWFTYSLGSGDPPSTEATPLITPKVGDLALNLHDGKVWRYTADGWVERPGSLQGPRGADGAQGADGTNATGNASVHIFAVSGNPNQFGQYTLSRLCGDLPLAANLLTLDRTKHYLITYESHWSAPATGSRTSITLSSSVSGPFTYDTDHGTITTSERFACRELAPGDNPTATMLSITRFGEIGYNIGSTPWILRIMEFNPTEPPNYTESRAEWDSGVLDSTIQTSAMRTDITLPIPPGTGGNVNAFARTASGHVQVKAAGKVEIDAGYYLEFTEVTRGAMEGYCRVSMGVKRRRGGDTETFPFASTETVRTSPSYYQNEAFISFRDAVDCQANDELILYLRFDDGGNIPSLGPTDQSRAAKWRYKGAGRNRVAVREVP